MGRSKMLLELQNPLEDLFRSQLSVHDISCISFQIRTGKELVSGAFHSEPMRLRIKARLEVIPY